MIFSRKKFELHKEDILTSVGMRNGTKNQTNISFGLTNIVFLIYKFEPAILLSLLHQFPNRRTPHHNLNLDQL